MSNTGKVIQKNYPGGKGKRKRPSSEGHLL